MSNDIEGQIAERQFPRPELKSLDPDEFDLKTATYVMFRPCPFCGANAGPVMDFVNEEPLFGNRPIYQSRLECSSSRCGAGVLANEYSRAEAQHKVVEKWQKRVAA